MPQILAPAGAPWPPWPVEEAEEWVRCMAVEEEEAEGAKEEVEEGVVRKAEVERVVKSGLAEGRGENEA